MTPEDTERIDRDLSRLYKGYREVEGILGRHDERIEGSKEDIKELKEDFRSAVEKINESIREVDLHCARRDRESTIRFEAWAAKLEEAFNKRMDEMQSALKDEADKVEKKLTKEQERTEWTVKERALLLSAVAGPTVTGLFLYLDKGPG